MTRSFRAVLCGTSLFVMAAGGAHAQTVPTTITTTTTPPPTLSTGATAPTTDFSVPTACLFAADDRNTDENHGEQMRACVRALRAELSENDDHQGLGEWVSALARAKGHGRPEGDDDEDEDGSTVSAPASGSTSTGNAPASGSTSTGSAPAIGSSSAASTATAGSSRGTGRGVTTTSNPSQPAASGAHHAQSHGHGHGDD